MNKNLFIYSFKYLAVLLALVTFSSCERDEFTEQDAFDLQQAQLDAQTARDEAKAAASDKRIMNMALFNRSIDSLQKLNSGGRVFYTVNVVPGGSTAFGSGRFEEVEGLDGAVVTVSQLGGAIVERKTTNAGLASFQMYSGEVTVNVAAPNHTDLNYTANLTPDGGVANGSLIYVGNVLPVFDDPNNPGAGSAANLATVRGFAFAELDITFGNNVEEPVPAGTKVRAFIDVAAPAFKSKYIDEANDENLNIDGKTTRSGFIQKYAYEEAASTTGTTVTASLGNTAANQGGQYSISIGATASGLPIQMKFDDFAANRRFVFGTADFTDTGSDQDVGTGTKRFLYTQNTELGTPGAIAPTRIPFIGGFLGTRPASSLSFNLVTTEATATATLTGGDAVQSVAITDGGYYYEAPTVTFSAAPTGGTTATGTAVLSPILPSAVAEREAARLRGLREVTGVTLTTVGGVVTGRGAGYTSTPTVTFTRASYTGFTGTVPVPNGTGSVKAASSTIKYIRIIDGGFGMNGLPTPFVLATTPITGVGEYTGVTPGVVFNNNVAPGNIGANRATANTIIDPIVGTATEIQIVGGGNGYSDATLAITFNYGQNATVTTTAGAITPALFVSNGAGGELRWNTGAGGARSLIATSGEVTFTSGSNYTFVPSVTVTGLTVPAGATAPTLNATVINGQVARIDIDGASSGWGIAGTEYTGTVTVSANPDGVAISARGFSEGGSIDTYVLTNYGSTTDVYKSTVEAAGQTFDYITTDATGGGTILANGAGAPLTTNAQFSASSDFVVVFENPTTGTSNAWGFPIFDNGGNNLVGILFAQGTGQGIGYTSVPAAGVNFWVLPNNIAGTPNAHLAQYAQRVNAAGDANASATATRTPASLTLTFTGATGLGYSIRPEFRVFGGNKSAEDLAALNAGINALRPSLTFNGAGSITNTSLVYTGPGLVFTAADLTAEPLRVTTSVARYEGILNSEVNGGLTTTPFNGQAFVGINAADNAYSGNYTYALGAVGGTAVVTGGTAPSPTTTALAFFDAFEATYPTDFVGVGGVGKYITAPRFRVLNNGVATGGVGVAVLNGAADITGLSTTTVGTLPARGANELGNDFSVPAAGERFRTIGGPSRFEVFSGLTYIRDVNYGTGIELE